jgi:hypothetical protein
MSNSVTTPLYIGGQERQTADTHPVLFGAREQGYLVRRLDTKAAS